MASTIINTKNLSKQYRIGRKEEGHKNFREMLVDGATAPIRNFRRLRSLTRFDEKRVDAAKKFRDEQAPLNGSSDEDVIWALRDISFEVKQGEVLGIIGRNGAGKSTLLKILSRITEPSSGDVWLYGRVSSLLEVGTGFHPELSGRENIFLNGAILGMKRLEIERKFEEIVAFADIEKFIDTPVKYYSSGMHVRLAFAVAAHLEPEILLIDEVLAVGDAAFQKKCLGKMENIAKEGRTVLFVSHNMGAITSLCTRCLLIDNGCLVFSGPPRSVVEEYLSKSSTYSSLPFSERKDRRGNGRVRFTDVSVLNDRLESVNYVTSGQDISISIELDMDGSQELKNAYIQIAFSGVLGQPLFVCLSRVTEGGVLTLTPGSRILCHIPHLPLLPGTYTYSIWCKVGRPPGTLEDSVSEAGKLIVAEGDFFGTGKLQPDQFGNFIVMNKWSIQ